MRMRVFCVYYWPSMMMTRLRDQVPGTFTDPTDTRMFNHTMLVYTCHGNDARCCATRSVVTSAGSTRASPASPWKAIDTIPKYEWRRSGKLGSAPSRRAEDHLVLPGGSPAALPKPPTRCCVLSSRYCRLRASSITEYRSSIYISERRLSRAGRGTYQQGCPIPERIASVCHLVAPAIEPGTWYCVARDRCDTRQC